MTAKSFTVPDANYRSSAGLNITHLERMAISPLAFKVNDDLPRTNSLRLGTINHLCSLEHEEFQRRVVVWKGGMTRPKSGEPRPTTNKSSADYKEFKAKHEAAGDLVVDQPDIDLCERIRRAVWSHPVAGRMLDRASLERSIYWEHELGVACKSKIDVLAHDCLADLKFLRDITADKVNRAIVSYMYHCQGAFYVDAVEALTGERRPYHIIAADTKEPFDVVVYHLDDSILALGRQAYTGWMKQYIECEKSKLWPGISDTVVKAELPQWAYDDWIDAEIVMPDGEVVSV